MNANTGGKAFREGCLSWFVIASVVVGGGLLLLGLPKQRISIPPVTTLADDRAQLGCFQWRHAFDPPLLTADELSTRTEQALKYAKESATPGIAAAAGAVERATEPSRTQADYDAAAESFEHACAAVGE
jgi:hypothetical protein